MKSYAYDLHTHSCLSPCGDAEMTPNNMTNLAKLAGCDILAVTDHNTCKNAPAVMKVGEELGLLVIPGMELNVAEEAHVVCLFEELGAALDFGEYVRGKMPKISNKPDIFGEQIIMNEADEIIGTEEIYLLASSFIGVNDVVKLVDGYGGVAYPAHVNRASFSVIASLGVIPPEAGFSAAELTYDCIYEEAVKKNPELSEKLIIRSSDAHYLDALAGEKQRIHLPELSRKAVIERIKEGKRAKIAKT